MIQTTRCLLAASLLSFGAPSQTPPCYADFPSANYLTGWSMGGPGLTVAIKLKSTSLLVITRIEVHTGGKTGQSTMLVYSHDSANNQPLSTLGSGTFTEVTTIGWQGANMTAPILVLPNTDFWFGWQPVGSEMTPTEGYGTNPPPTGAQVYRGSFNNGGSWNGPFTQHQWKIKIFCGGQTPGSVTTFGTACRGSNAQLPAIGYSIVPTIGQSYSMTLTSGPSTQPAFLGFGVSTTNWLGYSLPLSLTPYNAPSCTLYIDLPYLIPTTTNTAGSASSSISVPNNSGLVGQFTLHQWIALDPAANGLGLILSNAAKATVGN